MIENIRKYTGLMIVVLVLLFIGLVFLGGNVKNSFAGKPVMEIDGRAISLKEFERNARDVQRIATEIPSRVPLPRETRILASHYLDEDIIENPYVMAGSIIQQMGMYLQPSDGLPERFFANRIAVQKAGLEYGVTPSDDEVESFVENVIFADAEGKFDLEASKKFFDETAGKLGIGTRGFNEYIRDLMTAQNLSKIIGGGISPEKETVRALYDSAKQTISVKQISLDSMSFESQVNPTEEEIKAYYEENKTKYNSDEKRRISYFLAEPKWDDVLVKALEEREKVKKEAEEARAKAAADKKLADEAAERANAEKAAKESADAPAPAPAETDSPAPAETEAPTPAEDGPQGQTGDPGDPAPAEVPTEQPAADPATAETPAEEATTSEEPVTAPVVTEAPATENPAAVIPAEAVKPTPAPTLIQRPQDKLNGVEKKAAVDALNPKLTEFYQEIIDTLGADFEGTAAKHDFTVIKSEFFTKAEPPKDLTKSVSNAAIGTLADAVFQLPEEGDKDEKITPPYQTADGWFVGQLEEVQPSVPLTFEEAKTKVTVDLKQKMARELMIEKAKELREKLATAVKDGKSFDEVAKEEKQTVSVLPDLKAGQSFQGMQLPAPPAFDAAQYTNVGEVAPLKLTPNEDTPDRALVIFVEKREIVKDDAYQTGLESAFKGQSNITRYIAFQNWLYDQYNANDVKIVKGE